MGQHTVVQHSGWVVGQDRDFQRAVESRAVTDAQAERIERAGGVVFPSYLAAEDYCERVNYHNVSGLIPRVEGAFEGLYGMQIYIPKRLTVDEAIEIYEREKANIEAADDGLCEHGYYRTGGAGTCPMPPEEHHDPSSVILKTRLNEVDTFLNVLRDMKDGH